MLRDRFGALQQIADAAGRSLRLQYRGARLVGLVLPDGARVGYDYDQHGVLSAVRYSDGRTIGYQYDEPRAFHLLTGILLPDGSHSRYRYDELLRVAESIPPEGSRLQPITLDYRLPEIQGEMGETVVREGARVSRWNWKIDGGRSQLLSMEGESCSSCPVLEHKHPSSGSPTISKTAGYDAFGLLSEARMAGVAHTGDGVATPIAMHLRWWRHAEGPLRGKLAWVERLAPDGTAARTEFRHDERRMLVAVEKPQALIDRFERDFLGRPKIVYRADHRRLEARFDPAWRLSEWRDREAVTAIDWNDAGRPVSIAWPAGDRWTLHWQERQVEIRSDRGWTVRSAPPAPGMLPPAEALAKTEISSPGDSPPKARAAAVALVLSQPHPVVIDAAGRRTDRLYDDFGRLIEETSTVAGVKRFRHDAWGRICEIQSAGGIAERRRHDLAGRLVEREELAPDERILTRFRWDAGLLVGVDHPTQGTRVEHDGLGRITAIEHDLLGVSHRWTIDRDERERVIAQGLPDGSRLHHRLDRTGRPVGLDFEAAGGGPTVPIIERAVYRNGRATEWRYGNGTRFERRDDAAGRPLAWRWMGLDPLPDWRYQWSAEGLPLTIVDRNSERRFGWDAFGRLIIQERHEAGALQSEYFAWDLAGDMRLARRSDGSTWRDGDAAVPRSPAGMPLSHGDLALHYGAQQRISEVSRNGQSVAAYAYNAAGERAVKRVGSKTTGFLYRNRSLAAELDADGKFSRHYLRWQGQPVAIIDREKNRTSVTWLHGDHLGTPHVATDAAGRPVWRADFEAFGRVVRERGSFRQPLRFAGQYHDTETGLHDNYLRSYDPGAARYLEPDPLGLAGGLNPWAYADGNPLMGTDPLGLILFAFDGTNNGDPAPGNYDVSNVRKFYKLYEDKAWYMTGVGLNDPESGIQTNSVDPVDGNTARARVDYMLGQFETYLDENGAGETTNVDVIGFSRGAAMARDFVNRIAQEQAEDSWQAKGFCVNLRFLGLWDTVAQFGVLGSSNDEWLLSIPSTVRATYHAVAVNEHRDILPLERALGSAIVIERGFIGDHSDVGGGNAEGDLSNISLVWMAKMATQAGVPIRALPASYLNIESPVLHDRTRGAKEVQRTPRRYNSPLRPGRRTSPDNLLSGDRDINVRDVRGDIISRSRQRREPVYGMNWAMSRNFISLTSGRMRDAEGRLSIAGTVDMHGYATWLAEHYEIVLGAQ